jgi:cytochrome c biogenesis factor
MIPAGALALWIALATALLGAGAALFSLLRAQMGVSAGYAAAGDAVEVAGLGTAAIAVAAAVAAMLVSLGTGDVGVRYVAAVISADLPRAYRLAALWVAPAGALMVQTMVTVFAAAAFALRADARARGIRTVVASLGLVAAVQIAVLAFASDPFVRLDLRPADGLGLPPEFQAPSAILLPLARVLFAAVLTIVAASGLAALVTGDVRAWRRFARLLGVDQTVGALAAALSFWEAYRASGAAPGWATHAVVDLSVMAWLVVVAAATAMAHAPRVAALGSLAAAAMLVPSAAWPPRELRTFVTTPLGTWTAIAVGLTLLAGLWLLIQRTPAPEPPRAAAARWVRLTLFAGVAALVAGIAASRATRSARFTIADGASVQVTDVLGGAGTLTSQGMSIYRERNQFVTSIGLIPAHGTTREKLLKVELRETVDAEENSRFEPVSAPGVRPGLTQDLVVSLVAPSQGGAEIVARFVPLVWLHWLGFALLALVGIAMAVGDQRSADTDDDASARAEAEIAKWRDPPELSATSS